eukprot:gene3801-biopygen2659
MEPSFQEKMAKFGAAMQQKGVHFTPLILESTGRIREESLRWLRAIAETRPNPRDVGPALDDLMAKFAQTLHKGNCLLVRGAVGGARAFHGQLCTATAFPATPQPPPSETRPLSWKE